MSDASSSSGASAASAAAPRETRHQVKLRHKAELKALLAAPAKGIGAKKAQKEAAQEMESKHAAEMEAFDKREQAEKEAAEAAEAGEGGAKAEGEADEEADTSVAAPSAAAAAAAAAPAVKHVSKAQQKKAKAAQKDAARMAQLRAETAGMKDERGEENAAIAARLAQAGEANPLCVKEMVSDGHCLYRALADQLPAEQRPASVQWNAQLPPYMSLRQICASYLRAHRDDFSPFLLDEASGAPLDDASWEKYLAQLQVEELAVWGGHTEIVALSKALQRPIVVWSAGGRMEVGEEFKGAALPPLQVSFHKHYYGLGNHYNAVVPAPEDDDLSEQAAQLSVSGRPEGPA